MRVKKFIFQHALYWITKRFGYMVGEINQPRPFILFLKSYFGSKQLVGAEIGVWEGDNAKNILENLRISELHLIDPWESYDDYEEQMEKYEGGYGYRDFDSGYKRVMKNLEKYNDRIKILKMYSHEAVEHIEDNSLDFVYIDANHSYEYVLADLRNYWPKLKGRGVLGGHDTWMLDVSKAVLEFSEEIGQVPRQGFNEYWFIRGF